MNNNFINPYFIKNILHYTSARIWRRFATVAENFKPFCTLKRNLIIKFMLKSNLRHLVKVGKRYHMTKSTPNH